MDRRRVPGQWVGRMVVLIPLDERGASGYELRGWLRGVHRRRDLIRPGVLFRLAKEAHARTGEVLALGAHRASGTFA